MIAAWLLGMAVCALIVSRARFTADMSAFLPDAPTPEQRLLVDQLKDGLVSRLMLAGIEGGRGDAAARARVSRRMAATLRADPAFAAVTNGETDSLQADQAFLFANRYALSPAMSPDRFSVRGLRAAVEESLAALASPAGLLLASALPRDPTGEIIVIADALGGSSAGRGRPTLTEGVWSSKDGARAVLLLQTRAAGSDTDGQQAAVAAARRAFDDALHAEPSAAGARLALAGPGVFGVDVRERIERDVTRLSLVGTGVIVLVLLVLYRSPVALLLGLLPVASGVLAAIAAVSLGFGVVHGLTLGFGTTLIGEAVDYSIYYFVQSRSAGATTAEQESWLRRYWPTIRLGVLTSVFGFAALMLSGFPGLAQLGLYSIAGLVTAAVVTRLVLPHLVPTSFAVRDVTPLGRAFARRVAQARHARWPAAALVAAALIVIGTHHDRLWGDELSSLSPVSAADQALDQRLRADVGAPDVRYLVVAEAPSEQAALEAAEALASRLTPLVARNAIGGFDSPAQLLPSARTQVARLASIPPTPALRERLTEALVGAPLRVERLEPFLADAEAARRAPPVGRAALDRTALGAAIDGLLTRRVAADGSARWSAFLPLYAPRGATADTVIDPAPIRAALDTAPTAPGTRALFVDLKGEADSLYRGYLREALGLSLGGVVAIMLLVAVALRSTRRMLRVMVPLAASIAVVMAALLLAGVQLGILHLIGFLLVVAVGSNYALFFVQIDDDTGGLTPAAYASLLFANLSALAGFGILAFSSVPVLSAVGLTVGPGAVLALAFGAVFTARGAKRTASP